MHLNSGVSTLIPTAWMDLDKQVLCLFIKFFKENRIGGDGWSAQELVTQVLALFDNRGNDQRLAFEYPRTPSSLGRF